MNGQVTKRLRIAAVRHYIANNANTKADPSFVLKRTYKAMKEMYKSNPTAFPATGHGVVLAKIHDIRERSKVEKFLDPKASERINAQNVNELEGDL